jgi:predicted component of type VI protein secretion system
LDISVEEARPAPQPIQERPERQYAPVLSARAYPPRTPRSEMRDYRPVREPERVLRQQRTPKAMPKFEEESSLGPREPPSPMVQLSARAERARAVLAKESHARSQEPSNFSAGYSVGPPPKASGVFGARDGPVPHATPQCSPKHSPGAKNSPSARQDGAVSRDFLRALRVVSGSEGTSVDSLAAIMAQRGDARSTRP